MQIWNTLTSAFPTIIASNQKYQNIVNHIQLCRHNVLLHCTIGFPLDLFIDYLLKTIFDIPIIHKTQHVWNKSVAYKENQYFFEIDLRDLYLDNINIQDISQFILHIIQTKNVNHAQKHFIIIKHIDLLASHFYEFRILLERYQQNVTFLCTTHAISKIEAPIKSRFTIFRIPLFTNQEIQAIFKDHLKTPLNQYLIDTQTRNIVKAIFIAELEAKDPTLLNKQFCTYNFPPLYDFIKSFDKSKDNLDNIRIFSYKCCQYNISVLQLVEDFMKIIDDDDLQFIKIKYSGRIAKKRLDTFKNDLKLDIVNTASNIDNILCQANNSKEPLYIECFLCKLLL